MSKRKRNFIQDLEETPSPEIESGEPAKDVIPMSFTHWLDGAVKRGEVKYWQEEALLVFFKKKGLSEIADEDSYNRVFENF